MNKDNILRLLLAPLFFMVLLFVPGMILDILPNAYLLGDAIVAWNPSVIILCISLLVGGVIYSCIPIGVYIVMLAVYTFFSWTWILRKKKNNTLYFIVWLVLCVISILMYWKWGYQYYAMMNE